MLKAFVDRIDRTGVNGWAVNADDLTRRVPLRVLCNVNGYSEPIIAERLRPDLSGKPGMGDGRHGFGLRFPPEVSAAECLSIAIIDESSGKLLPGGFFSYPDSKAPKLSPIVVTAQGRSGTTMMMNTLLQSPYVCVSGNPPFEVRMAHYFAMAFRVLTAEANRKQSTDPENMDFNEKRVGSNPFYSLDEWGKGLPREQFYRYFALDVPDAYLKAYRSMIESFYEKDALSRGKKEARYFAEKNIWAVRLIPDFLRMMFPEVKELIMVRDPRDLVVSQRAYFQEVRATHIEEIGRFCTQYTTMAANPSDTLIVRYEDLVSGWERESKRVSDFLGAEIPLEKRDLVDKTFNSHARSSTPESSVGRWRTELSKGDRTTIETLCGPFMERFGYL